MPFAKGDPIPNDENILRRLKKRELIVYRASGMIPIEAFRPKKNQDGSFEDGVSLDVQSALIEPVGNDHWSNHPTNKKGTGQLIAGVINDTGYPIIADPIILHDGTNHPAHCLITGDMEKLYEDENVLIEWCGKCVVIHDPFLPN